ncbi:ProQ/FINO family protein [Pseudomonas aeruginosa]|uniref:ProQ/FINO family protein n=1 Tax=Pseudomonas aeruginosa TaxID=287 RepID=UPI0032E49A83
MSKAERHRRDQAKARAAFAVLVEHYPQLFNLDSVRPLAIGIDKELHAERIAGRLPLIYIPLRLALGWWTGRLAYLSALAAGDWRHDLSGQPVERVSDEQRAMAAARPERIHRTRQ